MPFEKGKSGNPAGRPRGSIDIRGEIAIMFAEKKMEKLEALLDAMIDKGIKKKHVPAARLVFEYLMAKPRADIKVTADSEQSLPPLNLPSDIIKLIVEAIHRVRASETAVETKLQTT